MKQHLFLAALIGLLLFPGCIQTLAIRTFGDILEYGFEALFEESDLQLAEIAIAGDLKLIEAMVKGDPNNEKLLLLTAEGYSAYALSFIEQVSLERARVFYLRGKEYGMRILNKDDEFAASIDKDMESFKKVLSRFSKDDVPAVFWTAFSWGSYINITRTDMSALADLPKVEEMMNFVLKHDSTYFYGGAHMFFGAITGSIPPALGGKPERAKDHFDRCIAMNNGTFLLANVYYAKTYAVTVQDRELFEKLLNEVAAFDLDKAPKMRLPNAVAKKQAKKLQETIEDYF
jgi:hypothetical protein